MAGKDIIEMSVRELRKLKAVQAAIDGHITQGAAASMVGLSERQVRRLVRAVREEGDRGIIHKARGRPSNRRLPEELRGRAMSLYKGKYPDFGPTFASEKLAELDGIAVSDETLRKWLIGEGLWKGRRKRSAHRRWRERKECRGEMVQVDGSHHDWLEGRGPLLVLMGYIDDATGEVFGRFYDYEGTMPAMDSFKRYVRKYGLPMSIYADRHTTYKSTRRLTPEEELEGVPEPLSQFQRAVKELGVEMIPAGSPQAKGRVERLFGVLQDRLVKEMRLRGVKSRDEANEFLVEYLPIYNKRFRVAAANEADAHVKLPKRIDLDEYLCIKTERTIRNDNTVAHDGKLYQVEEAAKTRKVVVEERVDGSIRIMGGKESLKYREITERPRKEAPAKVDRRKFHRPPAPAKDHPWRRWQERDRAPKGWAYAY
jgi:transposase